MQKRDESMSDEQIPEWLKGCKAQHVDSKEQTNKPKGTEKDRAGALLLFPAFTGKVGNT